MAQLLSSLPVLVIDCQTTGTHPSRAHIVDLGFVVGTAEELARGVLPTTLLVAPPEGLTLSPKVREMTGLSDEQLHGAGSEADAWRALMDELDRAKAGGSPAGVAVAHYSRFESAFLASLQDRCGGGALPTKWLCTQEIARRLLPELPSTKIRALSGYLGVPLPEHQRAASHVEATARIWAFLVRELGSRAQVTTLEELDAWMARKPEKKKAPVKRQYQLAREKRLALPRCPGIYRMLSADGTILYVGKSVCLRDRVNSYFRQRTKGKLPELMTQVSDIAVTEAETALEAAVMENDAIKAHNPRYNVSLRERFRNVWFFDRQLMEPSPQSDRSHPYGPFPSSHIFDSLSALSRVLATGEDHEEQFPGLGDPRLLHEGIARVFPGYPENHADLLFHGPLLRRAFDLYLAGRGTAEALGQGEEWTAENVAETIERRLVRQAVKLLRARWLLRLTDCSIRFSYERHDGERPWRLLVVERGQIVHRASDGHPPDLPVPPSWQRSLDERRAALDVTIFDRLRVLDAELRRISIEAPDLAIRLSPHVLLQGPALRHRLLVRDDEEPLDLPGKIDDTPLERSHP